MKKKYFFLLNYLVTASLVVIAFSQQGCLYDKPAVVTGCDTAKVTYSGSVKPILVANCVRCHNAPNAANVATRFDLDAKKRCAKSCSINAKSIGNSIVLRIRELLIAA